MTVAVWCWCLECHAFIIVLYVFTLSLFYPFCACRLLDLSDTLRRPSLITSGILRQLESSAVRASTARRLDLDSSVFPVSPLHRNLPRHPVSSSTPHQLMSSSREGRSASPLNSRSPVRGRRSRSLSKSRRSRSRSHDSVGAENPGNNLYVTGLSTRVTTTELEKYFSREGKVLECQLVTDPHTKESRGFGFVTMETTEDAERCIKHLNRSVLEGRLITVEKAKRKRGRTPTPGRYQGTIDRRGNDRRGSHGYSPRRRYERDPYSRDRRGRARSPYGFRRANDYSDSYGRRKAY